jgi:hypothetical protein
VVSLWHREHLLSRFKMCEGKQREQAQDGMNMVGSHGTSYADWILQRSEKRNGLHLQEIDDDVFHTLPFHLNTRIDTPSE